VSVWDERGMGLTEGVRVKRRYNTGTGWTRRNKGKNVTGLRSEKEER